jgi:hypothetical protein
MKEILLLLKVLLPRQRLQRKKTFGQPWLLKKQRGEMAKLTRVAGVANTS